MIIHDAPAPGMCAALLVQKGHTVIEAAARFGVSRNAVYHNLKKIGAQPPKGVRSGKQAIPDLILAEPTHLQIKQARLKADLTLRAAGNLIGSKADAARAWLRYESGTRQMGSDRWTLFMLATGQHPYFDLQSK